MDDAAAERNRRDEEQALDRVRQSQHRDAVSEIIGELAVILRQIGYPRIPVHLGVRTVDGRGHTGLDP